MEYKQNVPHWRTHGDAVRRRKETQATWQHTSSKYENWNNHLILHCFRYSDLCAKRHWCNYVSLRQSLAKSRTRISVQWWLLNCENGRKYKMHRALSPQGKICLTTIGLWPFERRCGLHNVLSFNWKLFIRGQCPLPSALWRAFDLGASLERRFQSYIWVINRFVYWLQQSFWRNGTQLQLRYIRVCSISTQHTNTLKHVTVIVNSSPTMVEWWKSMAMPSISSSTAVYFQFQSK